MAEDTASNITIHVEFTGGLEVLFLNQREHSVTMPHKDGSGKPVTMSHLINYLCESIMQDKRKDMFVVDDSVRPGVLVLINEADWELEGEIDYELRDGDNILFVSTLHGG